VCGICIHLDIDTDADIGITRTRASASSSYHMASYVFVLLEGPATDADIDILT